MRYLKILIIVAIPIVAGVFGFQEALRIYSSYSPLSYEVLENPFPGHVATPPEAVVKAIPVPDWAWRWRRWDLENVEKGKQLYTSNCASCHGTNLDGRGKWALVFRFPAQPSDFRAPGSPLEHHNIQHLFWRISEGGIQNIFNSAMPSWATFGVGGAGRQETIHTGDLSAEEIWEILRYIYRTTEKKPVIGQVGATGGGGH